MMFSNLGKRTAAVFILFIVAFIPGLLFADVSAEIGTELISTVPQPDMSNSNGWIGLNWMGSRYFSDTLSLFADASFKTAYTPFTRVFEAISSGDTYLSYRENPFLIRWGISGYYDFRGSSSAQAGTEGIISSVWQASTNILFSYGTYKFSVYAEPGIALKQEIDLSAPLSIKTGAAYAVNDELLLKPAVSLSIPLINTGTYSPAVVPMLDLSWYLSIPMSVESKISYEVNLPMDKNDFVLTWAPQISILLARGVTASLRSRAEYRTYQSFTLGTTDTVFLGSALSWYDPSLELLPALLFDFDLADSITLHSGTDLDWIHYFQSNTDNFTASLSLDIEIEF